MIAARPLFQLVRRWAPGISLSLLIGACGSGEAPVPPGGMRGGAAVSVIAGQIEPRSYTDQFNALGTATSNESIYVTSRISSVVTRILFEEGQRVNAGDLLVELDNRDLAAQKATSEAALRKVRSQYERRKTLVEAQVISAAELDELEADVMMAEAELRGAEARLRDSFVRAPFAGTVGLRLISLGDLVGPDTVITTLDDMETMKLEFTIPEAFLGVLATGMTIQADSSVYPGRRFTGEVTIIDPRIDPATRSVKVIAALPNRERLVRPGMFLTVALQRSRDNVLLVPEEALLPRQGRQYLFVVEDGKAIEREVTLGVRAPGLAEIREGLAPGETVIFEGTQKIRSGAPVAVHEREQATS